MRGEVGEEGAQIVFIQFLSLGHFQRPTQRHKKSFCVYLNQGNEGWVLDLRTLGETCFPYSEHMLYEKSCPSSVCPSLVVQSQEP